MLVTLEDIRKRNEELIIKSADNNDILLKQQLIKKLLMDEDCFFKVGIDDAYSILLDLGYNEKELKEIYMNLVSYKSF